jgi:hypothetical protein
MAAKKPQEQAKVSTLEGATETGAEQRTAVFIPSVEQRQDTAKSLHVTIFKERTGSFVFTGEWTGRDISYLLRRIPSEYRLHQRTLRRAELSGLAKQTSETVSA